MDCWEYVLSTGRGVVDQQWRTDLEFAGASFIIGECVLGIFSTMPFFSVLITLPLYLENARFVGLYRKAHL